MVGQLVLFMPFFLDPEAFLWTIALVYTAINNLITPDILVGSKSMSPDMP